MNKRTLRAKTALVLAFAMLAGPGFALDLTASYEKARQHDPRMLAAGQALLAGREKSVQGDALLKPQIGLSSTLLHVRGDSGSGQTQGGADSSGNVHQIALQLSKPLYSAKAQADRKQMHQQAALAEVSHRDAQQDLMQRVSESYFGVLLAQEQLRVVQAERRAVSMQRDRAQARFDAGRGKITDLQETQARLDNVSAKELSVQGQLASRQAQYQALTNVPAQGLAELRAGFAPVAPQPDDLSAWQAKGQNQNSRVLMRQGDLAIADAEIAKYRLDGRPTLDLVASLGHKGQNGGLLPTVAPDSKRSGMVGLQFSMPLYTGGGLDSRLRESIARKQQAEHEVGAAQRDARLQVQDAWVAVQTAIARVAALEQSVRSAQTALEATMLGRDLGTRIDLDVLDAQQRLFNNQLDLAQARNDYLLGRVRLAYAAGELQESDLFALNAYLAP